MKNSGPYPPSVTPPAPPVAAERLTVPAAVFKPDHAHVLHSINYSSGQLIDLTLEDEEDEPMGSQMVQESVAIGSSASSAASDALKLSLLDGTGNEAAVIAQSMQQDEEMMKPLAEDVESDVDEEWPRVPAKVASSALLSVKDHVFHSQTREDVGATLNAICKTIPLSIGGQRNRVLDQNDQVKVTRQQAPTSPLYDDGDDEMDADVDEELPNQAPKADENAVCSPTTADRIVQVESLEDGEIYEEGVASKPVMQANMLEHQSGSVGMHLVDAMGIRPHLRSKKQKKRGKKKTKRKLEAMQMLHVPPGQIHPEYERTIRQRPFADAPPPGHYTLGMVRNGPRGEPMNVRPMFQDASSALFRAGGLRAGVPYPPVRPPPPPPPQQRPTPPLPAPYEDSQILRVNRQGSMEMIDGEAEQSLCTIYGGFKYRPVSVCLPPPVPNGPGLPLQRFVGDSSRLPFVPTSSGGNTTNSVASRGRDDSGDVDLDSLRAAALRTKTKRLLKKMERTTETEIAVQSSPSSSRSFSRPAHSEEKQTKPTSPEIDKLRFDIYRSITKNRKRTANSKPTPQLTEPNAIEKFDESRMNIGIKSNSVAAQADPSALKDSSEGTLTHISADADHAGGAMHSSEMGKSTITSDQNQVISKSESQLATSLEKAKPSAKCYAVSTPEFRPLTASSQSLVIQLSPEDFLPQKSGDDARSKATVSSSLQDAIQEMRRKIAEREKEQTNRLLVSVAPGLSKPSSGSPISSALSSLSPESKVSSVVTQLLSAKAASPGVSSPVTEIMKELAGVNEDRIISAQTDANQETQERAIKEVLPSPSEAFPSVESAKSAAGRESALKATLEPQVRSGISSHTHVLPPILQHQSQASSDGRNGDPASELCVKKSIEPVPAV